MSYQECVYKGQQLRQQLLHFQELLNKYNLNKLQINKKRTPKCCEQLDKLQNYFIVEYTMRKNRVSGASLKIEIVDLVIVKINKC